jgi:hypothetical protein
LLFEHIERRVPCNNNNEAARFVTVFHIYFFKTFNDPDKGLGNGVFSKGRVAQDAPGYGKL